MNENKMFLPWTAARHPDPLCSVLYIKNAQGEEICTFYGNFEDAANYITFILAQCNPKEEKKLTDEAREIA